MTRIDGDAAYWSEDAAHVGAALGSGPKGLTAGEAARRLATAGPNAIDEDRGVGTLQLLARQFRSPLVLILVFGAAISFAVQEWVDGYIILAIILGSTVLGFYQEYRASAAVAQLRQRLALKCRVLRDGSEATIPVSAIVPGDVIMLSAGNLVPADCLVLQARDFLVSESSLTGESFPVEKQPGPVPSDAPVARRRNVVFLGSSVRSGSAAVMAVRTGGATAFGAIAARLKARMPETAFAQGIRRFGYMLVQVMIGILLFVLTVNQFLDRPVIESLLFAVALAVGLSPELLPAIMSVTLSAGAREMARHGVIVRQLESIENIGGIDILCTDKTGTLTAGVVALDDALDATGIPSEEVRHLAFVNAELETGIRNPLDEAIVADGARRGLSVERWRKVDEIPYDFLRKRLTIVVAGDRQDQHSIITKGAFDHVMECCSAVRQDGIDVPLTPERRAGIAALYRNKSLDGFRVLAVACRNLPAQQRYTRDDEHDMSLVGLLLFFDPPKPGVDRTIRELAARGIAIKVISGDNEFVTAHLARTIGLDPGAMLTGAQLSVMNEETLWNLAPRTTLFVDVDPQQKERIVRALQHMGHSVGFLGDGINDAPALHAADVGISVESAVDVARESADLILLERDLDVLCRGIDEGRRTFANTLKYITITISANFGNMISMALATPFLPFLPLLATQILLNNFISDVPSIAISTDNVDPERTRQAQKWRIADIRKFMLVFGLISSAFDLLTFAALLYVFHAGEAEFQTTWFVISLLTELAVVLVLRTRRPMWRSRPSRTLLSTTVLVILVALAIPFLGRFVAPFGFVPLTPSMMAAIIVIVLAYIAATEAAKLVLARKL
jgi:Mg2+-importing ATPase